VNSWEGTRGRGGGHGIMEKTGIAPGENVLWPGAGFSCDSGAGMDFGKARRNTPKRWALRAK